MDDAADGDPVLTVGAVRRALSRRGSFRRGKDSARAVELGARWDAAWHVPPLGHLLRQRHEDRWFRVWSLPDGKRYADTADEHAEVLRRHRTVLEALLPPGGSATVIAADFGAEDIESGWTRSALPDRWPWRRSDDHWGLDEDDDVRRYLWVQDMPSVDALTELLVAAADDRAQFVATGPDATWVYCPYDGGADVIVADSSMRDRLAARFRSWAPSTAQGL
ncbi:hypothetical protein [Curtobacterium sp. VKM Ac-2922]|uniref:DUF3885 domain-containing protein n=1 Tax=Curtobacterium sp. VKM Ac-2922 TaxID=2929475 RepID=UPI001FB2A76F|nr:hypothetical protein [Curtobacterium sp. VKM Ac-2922]MCJ1714963.1 hypothetical protein [Curtobacterium sp. VKM Ac-2922]